MRRKGLSKARSLTSLWSPGKQGMACQTSLWSARNGLSDAHMHPAKSAKFRV